MAAGGRDRREQQQRESALRQHAGSNDSPGVGASARCWRDEVETLLPVCFAVALLPCVCVDGACERWPTALRCCCCCCCCSLLSPSRSLLSSAVLLDRCSSLASLGSCRQHRIASATRQQTISSARSPASAALTSLHHCDRQRQARSSRCAAGVAVSRRDSR